jgi:cell division protein FtsW
MDNIKHRALNWPLLIVTGLLIAIGIIMLFSTSPVIGFTGYNDSYFFIKKYFFSLFIGSIALILGILIPYKTYQKYAFAGIFFSISLLLLTFLPEIGRKVGGANRWLNLYIIQFQPVEIVKFFIAIFLAAAIAHKKNELKFFFKGLIPILLILGIPLALLGLQPDLGNIILILGVSFTLLFLSNTKLWHFFILIISGCGLIIGSILSHPYQIARIKTFLSPWADPLGQNYHTIQSFTAIGSGGLFGLGLGQSKLKYFYLPLHYSDFIYSIICEEGGFILALIVLFLFAFLFFTGLKIALRSSDTFGRFLAIGLTLFLVGQAIINIGVVVGLLPTTGIPLTFISYGGSSLISSLFFIGVLLNISKSS